MFLLLLAMLETPEEKQKFAALYEANRDRMFSVARGVLRDEHLAEDAVQQAFLRLIRYPQKIEGFSCSQARNYLVIVVKNTAIDMYNHRRKIAEVPFDDSDGTYMDGDLTVRLDYDELPEAIDQLPVIYSEALYLSYHLGLSVNEIAGSLHLSASAVKLRLMRARQKLRAILEGVDAK